MQQPVLDAEKAVLTACISEPEALMDVVEALTKSDFSDSRNMEIFSELETMVTEGRPVDSVLLCNSLRTGGKLERAGGQVYIEGLAADVFSVADSLAKLPFYMEIVRRESIRRTLFTLTKKWVHDLKTESPDDVLDNIQADILSNLHSEQKSAPSRIFDIAALVSGEIEKMANGSYTSPAIPTGLAGLDECLGGGMYPGDLVILAARPSQGKSALALQMALHAASAGSSTLIFSVEMSKEQNAQRVLSLCTSLGLMSVRLGSLSPEERKKVTGATRKLADVKLWIDDRAAITPSKIRTTARRLQAKHGLKMIIVDYLQLMSGGTRFANRVEEVSYLSRCLKGIAKDLGVPLVALSQLNREAARSGEKPELHHLRESGSVEQDADVVMFIHPKGEDKVDLIVAKQRQGPLQTIKLKFNRNCTKFEG